MKVSKPHYILEQTKTAPEHRLPKAAVPITPEGAEIGQVSIRHSLRYVSKMPANFR